MNKLNYDRDYTDRLETRKRQNEVLHKNTLEYKSSMHQKQKAAESALKEADKKRNPFVAKVNEQSLAKATLFRQKQEQRKRAGQTESLEFMALQDEMDDDGEIGGMEINSGLDMLGEAENAQHHIKDKLDLE